MATESIRKSFLYKAGESFGNQGIAFIVNIILARLIDPSDYGVLTLLTVFIAISRVFVNSGLNTALVQKENIDEQEYHSAFYFSFALACLMYGLLYVFAPSIANFYQSPVLVPVLRVLALVLFPGSLTTILQAKVARERKFQSLMQASLLATLCSGIIGIGMALHGFAYWTLVAQQCSNQLFLALFLSLRLRFWPKAVFSMRKLLTLLHFGWKLLVSGIVDVVYENLRALVIGKRYTRADLGYYNRGRQFPELVMSSINSTLQSVLLPILSKVQNSQNEFVHFMQHSVRLGSFVVFPLMIGLAVTAKPLIALLLGEKWLLAVPFLQLACVDFALFPLHTANLQAINAKGRSDLFLKLELIKKIYGIAILLVSIWYFQSVFAIVAGASISSILSFFVNASQSHTLLGYGIGKQCRDILPNLLLSIAMGLLCALPLCLPLPNAVILALQIVVGVASYVLLAYLSKNPSFILLWNGLKRRKHEL